MVGSKVKRLITLPASTLLFTLPPHGHRSDRFLKETIPHGGWPSFRATQHCGPVCRGETSSRWNLPVSKVASVHGLRYIFEERLPSSDRILWSAAVFLCLLLSGTMVVQVGNWSLDETARENKSRAGDKNLVWFTSKVYLGWVESPVLTTITTTASDITELDFPTITICREVFSLSFCFVAFVSGRKLIYILGDKTWIDVYGKISLPVHVTDALMLLMRWCC